MRRQVAALIGAGGLLLAGGGLDGAVQTRTRPTGRILWRYETGG
jgi:hypothetical protein